MRSSLGQVAGWLIVTTVLGACGASDPGASAPTAGQDAGVQAGEVFLDAFYSWDVGRLESSLVGSQARVGDDELASVRYYQAWAEAGNYQIQTRRACERLADGRVACAVTVTDDLGRAMDYVATDTFWLTLSSANQITGVTFTADDPPVFAAVYEWLQQTRPEVFSGPCEGMFTTGTTPGDCVRAVVAGAEDYMRTRAGQH